jgi:hypothetical protein
VLSHCIAVGLFSVQPTVAWVKQWNVFVTTDISVPLRRCVVMVQYFRFRIVVTIRVPGTCHNMYPPWWFIEIVTLYSYF